MEHAETSRVLKRKKIVCANPNPLFEKWLTEWKQEAADKGLKTKYIYGKALQSLKKYPLPLKSGKEAKILENFGDKICRMLDEKLKEYNESKGLNINLAGQDSSSVAFILGSNAKEVNKASKTKNKISTEEHKKSNDNLNENIEASYSGSNAILLTLLKYEEKYEQTKMQKMELINAAQSLCHSSFTVPKPGTYYTAWSLMGQLIKKGFVTKSGNPSWFSLTDSGRQKVIKLKKVRHKSSEKISASSTNLLQNKKRPLHLISDSEDSGEDIKLLEVRDNSLNKKVIITESELPVVSFLESKFENSRQVRFSPDKRHNKLNSSVSSPQKEQSETMERVEVEIDSDYLPELDDDFINTGSQLQKLTSFESKIIDSQKLKSSSNMSPKKYSVSVSPISSPQKRLANEIETVELEVDSDYLPELDDESLNVHTATLKSFQNAGSELTSQDSLRMRSTHVSLQRNNTYSSSQESTKSSSCNNFAVEQFFLIPGNFEIVLCVDTCEATGGSKAIKLAVLSELKGNGVNYEVRKLNVGDFVWIAKEISKPFDNHDSRKELVLDFVVERKRMDDLAHSIKDGRFHEQKFRLKNCGLNRPVYLVEDYGSVQNFSLPSSTLEQAIINTQVIDGFTIKRTKDQKESVAYLTLMTRYLKRHYESRMLSSHAYNTQETESSTTTFMTFKEFHSVSAKNKKFTVREMFAKQLLQLSGLSIDKAAAIIERYPCPLKLMKAYDDCSSKEECEKLLANLKCKRSQRNLGPALSKSIAQLYTIDGALP